MNKIQKKFNKLAGKIANKITSATAQDQSQEAIAFEVTDTISTLARKAGAEGIVMLKNNDVLPIGKDETVSVFGRVQNDFFFVGYGSGGDVNAPYKIAMLDGMRSAGISLNEELAEEYKKICKENPIDDGFWGHWPMSYDEVPVSKDICKKAAEKSDKAIIVIGRSAGEDRESLLKKGSYLLTDEEKELINNVTEYFDKVILLLNCGSIMDLGEITAYGDKISAILYIWQAGMESGNAIADILSGRVSPSGKLVDTIAKSYQDYPGSDQFADKEENYYVEDIYVGYRYFETFAKDKVIYPFGFGLSYTSFEITNAGFEAGENIKLTANVKNTGSFTGKETVQVYFEAPQGKLGKPSRVLVTYKKTDDINPNNEENVILSFPASEMSSYDESKSAFVLEKGTYKIYAGSDVRSAELFGEYEIAEDTVIQQLSQFGAPKKSFKVMTNDNGKLAYKDVALNKRDLKKTILENLPAEIKRTGNKGIKLADVKNGKATMDEFVAQLDNDELETLSRGDFTMDSPLGAPGNAGAMSGISQSLRDKGVPPMITTDGPSGIRLKATSSLLPIGVSLACTWNAPLIEELYAEIGKEMSARGSDILLAPGMNIHRNPLCGRNFEYFSEDPVVTGKCGAALVRGVQKYGLSACPKHFACNNQETNRTWADSILSERALREIYLLGFEICVKTADPHNIMTSYNRVNGVNSHYNYEIVTGILKNEWGYKGNVMTDWWMRKLTSPEFPKVTDQAYRVRAGVNVLMPGGEKFGSRKRKSDGTLIKSLKSKDGITLGELQKNAKDVLNMSMLKIK